jgi:glucosamine 6-phosphate synthetase-like amidotransferase/phosphosugar isomerase protein
MCGIVAYKGKQNGLQALEYNGIVENYEELKLSLLKRSTILLAILILRSFCI